MLPQSHRHPDGYNKYETLNTETGLIVPTETGADHNQSHTESSNSEFEGLKKGKAAHNQYDGKY